MVRVMARSGPLRVALAMSAETADRIVTPELLNRLRTVAEVEDGVLTDFTTPQARAALADVDVLLTGWGCPAVTAGVLNYTPHLKAIVHAAGSVREHVTEACWDAGIQVSSAADANAVPVAEYTLAMVLLAGKGVLWASRQYHQQRAVPPVDPAVGNYGITVGILSASLIGRRVIRLLQPHDFRVLVHDPFVSEEEIRALGGEPAGLEELFDRSDVLSVHTPLLPETRGLVSAGLLARLRSGATLINTARGAVLDEGALTEEVVSGRLFAVLDVTDPEPPEAGSPLWTCPNVLLTPHRAGSAGNELARLTASSINEIERLADGRPLEFPVSHPSISRTA